MFYKDRTLLRMSLRKTLGFGPHVGFPLIPFSTYFFYSVRDKKEEDKIDSVECGRQRLRQRSLY